MSDYLYTVSDGEDVLPPLVVYYDIRSETYEHEPYSWGQQRGSYTDRTPAVTGARLGGLALDVEQLALMLGDDGFRQLVATIQTDVDAHEAEAAFCPEILFPRSDRDRAAEWYAQASLGERDKVETWMHQILAADRRMTFDAARVTAQLAVMGAER